MKVRRNIYFILGVIFVLLDVLSTSLQFDELKSNLSFDAYGIGVLTGSQFFLIIGVFLLYGAYNVQRKIKVKNRKELEEAFSDIAE